jgi:hypothetical protein
MTKNTLTVSIERTINLGNYENIKLIVGETVEFSGIDGAGRRKELMENLMEEIDDFVEENEPDND